MLLLLFVVMNQLHSAKAASSSLTTTTELPGQNPWLASNYPKNALRCYASLSEPDDVILCPERRLVPEPKGPIPYLRRCSSDPCPSLYILVPYLSRC